MLPSRTWIFPLLLLISVASYAQVSFTSSNLPIVVINTNGQTILDEPKITADMGIINNGAGQRNNITDPFNDFSGKIGIEIRGSSSQMFPKKQYGIELRDAAGAGIDASLLGMPKKDDWVLFAPYNDKSLMRDALAYKLGRDMGRYASRVRYCEVVINDQYMGVYVLLEKVKRDKNRVSIDKLEPTEITGDNVTGGYIIKIDKATGTGGEGWTSSFTPPNRSGAQTVFFQYEYPKSTDIVFEQKAYIKKYMDDFEAVLAGSNFKDSNQGYAKYIDVDSFIDYFIANEVTKNPDAYRLSTYMYKKKDSDGGKLFMGPIWDFNLGFGNVDYCTKGTTDGFVTDFNTICPFDYWLIPFWWKRFMQDEAFKIKLATRWKALRDGPYQTYKILSYVDSVATVLKVESQQRNFQRWPVLGQYVWPNYYIGQTFDQEVNWLKFWVTQRLMWLDANMPTLVTGVEQSGEKTFSVQAYPNPSSGKWKFKVDVPQAGFFLLEIYDSSGKKVNEVQTRYNVAGTFEESIENYSLSTGIYFFRANWNNQTQSGHLLLK